MNEKPKRKMPHLPVPAKLRGHNYGLTPPRVRPSPPPPPPPPPKWFIRMQSGKGERQ